MKTTTVNFKTDDDTKAKAQAVSKRLGIPLSNILNAYLHEIATTGSVHFSVAEPMTQEVENSIEIAEKEIAEGDVSGPFITPEELFTHLDSLQ